MSAFKETILVYSYEYMCMNTTTKIQKDSQQSAILPCGAQPKESMDQPQQKVAGIFLAVLAVVQHVGYVAGDISKTLCSLYHLRLYNDSEDKNTYRI